METPQARRITQKMRGLYQEYYKNYNDLTCREDFFAALTRYRNSQGSSRLFREKALRRLCESHGIDMKLLLSDESILAKIPTRSEMKDRILDTFYRMYANAPKTADFMERTVRRLAPEYAADSLRLAILKKFLAGAGERIGSCSTAGFWHWAQDRLDPALRASLNTLSERARRALLLEQLDDTVFDRQPIRMQGAETLSFLAQRIEKYRLSPSLAFQELVLRAETAQALRAACPLSECATDTQRVLALAQNDAAPDTALVNAIERDFRAQLKTIRFQNRAGRECTAEELYLQDRKYAKAKLKDAANQTLPDPDLLALCTDLAAGNLRVNGTTRKQLYYFAFLFEMTFSPAYESADPERDLESNLFHDYYNDNLLRVLSADAPASADANPIEPMPTGEGINYKNYAEVLYLYYLYHTELYDLPADRLNAAEDMIELCAKRAKRSKDRSRCAPQAYTRSFRDTQFATLLTLEPEALADYVTQNYQILPPANTGMTRLMLGAQENTAFDLIEKARMELDSSDMSTYLFDVQDLHSDAARVGSVLSELQYYSEPDFHWQLPALLRERFSGDKQFMSVVEALQNRIQPGSGHFQASDRRRMLYALRELALSAAPMSYATLKSHLENNMVVCEGSQLRDALRTLCELGYDIQRSGDTFSLRQRSGYDEELTQLLRMVCANYFRMSGQSEQLLISLLASRLPNNKRVHRTELISAHFHYYICTDPDVFENAQTFSEAAEYYAGEINKRLTQARYQPLSAKNLFDSFVVTELFLRLLEDRELGNGS